jgi:hypothetical protein
MLIALIAVVLIVAGLILFVSPNTSNAKPEATPDQMITQLDSVESSLTELSGAFSSPK